MSAIVYWVAIINGVPTVWQTKHLAFAAARKAKTFVYRQEDGQVSIVLDSNGTEHAPWTVLP